MRNCALVFLLLAAAGVVGAAGEVYDLFAQVSNALEAQKSTVRVEAPGELGASVDNTLAKVLKDDKEEMEELI